MAVINEPAPATGLAATTPHTVPCVWGCGYLADTEPDLEDHELACEHETIGIPDTPGGVL